MNDFWPHILMIEEWGDGLFLLYELAQDRAREGMCVFEDFLEKIMSPIAFVPAIHAAHAERDKLLSSSWSSSSGRA